MPMKPYDRKAVCPKCRWPGTRPGGGIVDKYVPIRRAGFWWWARTVEAVMRRTCAMCGYSWDEAPLDAEESPDA